MIYLLNKREIAMRIHKIFIMHVQGGTLNFAVPQGIQKQYVILQDSVLHWSSVETIEIMQPSISNVEGPRPGSVDLQGYLMVTTPVDFETCKPCPYSQLCQHAALTPA